MPPSREEIITRFHASRRTEPSHLSSRSQHRSRNHALAMPRAALALAYRPHGRYATPPFWRETWGFYDVTQRNRSSSRAIRRVRDVERALQILVSRRVPRATALEARFAPSRVKAASARSRNRYRTHERLASSSRNGRSTIRLSRPCIHYLVAIGRSREPRRGDYNTTSARPAHRHYGTWSASRQQYSRGLHDP